MGGAVGCPVGKTSKFRQGFIVKESLMLWPLKQNQAKQNACCLVLSVRDKGHREGPQDWILIPPPTAAISKTQPQGPWAGGTALQGESRVSVHPGSASVCGCAHCRRVSHCTGTSRVRPCLVSVALSERDHCYFYFLMRTQAQRKHPSREQKIVGT